MKHKNDEVKSTRLCTMGERYTINISRFCWVYEQSPTLTKSGKVHGYIRMDKYLHWYEAFWGKAQKQIHEGLGPKWTISYHCGDMWCL